MPMSAVELCAAALVKIGARPFAAFEEDTAEAACADSGAAAEFSSRIGARSPLLEGKKAGNASGVASLPLRHRRETASEIGPLRRSL